MAEDRGVNSLVLQSPANVKPSGSLLQFVVLTGMDASRSEWPSDHEHQTFGRQLQKPSGSGRDHLRNQVVDPCLSGQGQEQSYREELSTKRRWGGGQGGGEEGGGEGEEGEEGEGRRRREQCNFESSDLNLLSRPEDVVGFLCTLGSTWPLW